MYKALYIVLIATHYTYNIIDFIKKIIASLIYFKQSHSE